MTKQRGDLVLVPTGAPLSSAMLAIDRKRLFQVCNAAELRAVQVEQPIDRIKLEHLRRKNFDQCTMVEAGGEVTDEVVFRQLQSIDAIAGQVGVVRKHPAN
ncbi:hypothetical protein D9M70_625670 [compost metagenome]